jgi:ribosomal protein L35
MNCKNCSSSFESHDALLDHFYLFHAQSNRSNTCPSVTCNRNFKNFSASKRHYLKMHIESDGSKNSQVDSILECPFCKAKIIPQKNIILTHIFEHTSLTCEVDCPISNCTHKYKNKNAFKSHIYRNHKNWSLRNLKQIYYTIENASLVDGDNYYESESDHDINLRLPENPPTETLSIREAQIFLVNLAVKYEARFNLSKLALNELFSDIKLLAKLNRQLHSK